MIRFKLIAGLYDMEIKKDVYSMEANELEETVKLVNKQRRLLGYQVQLKLVTYRQGLQQSGNLAHIVGGGNTVPVSQRGRRDAQHIPRHATFAQPMDTLKVENLRK